jgi:hypothetical protein
MNDLLLPIIVATIFSVSIICGLLAILWMNRDLLKMNREAATWYENSQRAQEEIQEIQDKYFAEGMSTGKYDAEAMSKDVDAIYLKYGISVKREGEIK